MTWFLLILSLLLLQFHRTLSLAALLATTVSALFSGVMDWRALIALWGIIAIAIAYPRTHQRPWLRRGLALLVAATAAGLAFHLFPDFITCIICNPHRQDHTVRRFLSGSMPIKPWFRLFF